MIILGIDPGCNVTGYGIIESDGRALKHIDNGGIKTDAKSGMPKRLLHICDSLSALFQTFKPDIVVIENVFVAKNVRSSLLLGHARGVAMLAASKAGLEVFEYTPAEIKKAIVGTGDASKHQVQHMVRAILKLPEVAFEDASDALAAAICHSQTSALNTKIAAQLKRG